MVVLNNSNKVLGIGGNVCLFPKTSGEIPVEYETNPLILDYIRHGKLLVLEETTSSIPIPDTQKADETPELSNPTQPTQKPDETPESNNPTQPPKEPDESFRRGKGNKPSAE